MDDLDRLLVRRVREAESERDRWHVRYNEVAHQNTLLRGQLERSMKRFERLVEGYPVESVWRKRAERLVEAARRAKREAHGGHYAGCEAVSILTEALDVFDREEADGG